MHSVTTTRVWRVKHFTCSKRAQRLKRDGTQKHGLHLAWTCVLALRGVWSQCDANAGVACATLRRKGGDVGEMDRVTAGVDGLPL